jgi:hypothetical protein
MYSSVKAGMLGLDENTKCVFVLPVDLPLVRPATLSAMMSACPQGGSSICYPTFDGRRGHPPLIARAHVPAVLGYSGERGLAGLLSQLRGHAVDVPVIDQFIHADMDSPEDYRLLSECAKNMDCFTPDECRELLKREDVPAAIGAHGRTVADVALRIGSALIEAGCSLDLPLIRAAALVHDIARHEKDHAARGGEMLRALGMPRMAEIVEAHMDLPPYDRTGEAEVVFLADKLVREDRFVGLNTRFEHRLRETPANSPAAVAIQDRLECARRLSDRIGTLIGQPVERLFTS